MKKKRNRYNHAPATRYNPTNGDPRTMQNMPRMQANPVQPAAQPVVNFAVVDNYAFNIVAILAIDMTGYVQTPMPGEPLPQGYHERRITVHLAGPTSHVFEERRADIFYTWWLQWTGQARVAGS